MVELKEKVHNYKYAIYQNDCNLGDVYFDIELQICRVRFYGWFLGKSLVDLEKICAEIKNLEDRLKNN